MDPRAFRNYVGFTDDDGARLRAIWPAVQPELERLCTLFYERAMAEPSTRAVLHDEAQVKRLMATLKVWLAELMNGPWDEAYADRRRRIGDVHVRVGVSHGAMFAAMAVVRNELLRIACDATHDVDTQVAICRATEVDLMLMTGRYHETRKSHAVRDTQALLITHLPSMVLLVDRSHQIREATPSVASRFGVERVTGAALHDVLPAELLDGGEIPERLEHAWTTRRVVTVTRVDVGEGDEQQHLAVTLVPIRDGETELAMVQIDDHTFAVRAESSMRRQESLARLGAMSATIAHELRNPLAGISGALQVISRRLGADPQYGTVFTKVIDQVHTLNRIVSDLLAFARQREPEIRDGVDLAPLCADVLAMQAADFPGAQMWCEGTGTAEADADMVRQIVTNLVANAAQATEGAGRVRVRVDAGSVEVEDDGPGIPPDVAEHLFEPFRTTKLRGTGLGLSISQRLANLMHATLTLEPPGDLGGARFALRFSRRRPRPAR
jgi:signal transduction histidine kinase